MTSDFIDETLCGKGLQYGFNPHGNVFPAKDCIADRNSSSVGYLENATSLQNSATYEKVNKVNEESSLNVLYLTLAELLPTAVTTILFGIYSDYSKKRKFLMYLPCLGTAVYSICFVISLRWCAGERDCVVGRTLMVIASIVSGLSGSYSGYLCGNSSYISDTDTLERRTRRLALVEFFIGITFGLTSLMNGYLIRSFENFEQPFWIVFIISLLAFFLVLLFLEEPEKGGHTYDRLSVGEVLKRNVSLKHLLDVDSTARKRILITFVGFITFVFVQQGQERTFVPFLKGRPFFWDSTRIGIFLFVVYTFAGLGAWPGVILMRKAGEVVICIISTLSKFLGSIFLALATNSAEAYGAGLIQLFHLAPYAVARSIITQEISPDGQASIYAIIHSAQSVVGFLGPVSHNALYALTMTTMSGLVFIISGCFLVISLAAFTWIYFLEQKDSRYGDLDGRKSAPGDGASSESTAFASLSRVQSGE